MMFCTRWEDKTMADAVPKSGAKVRPCRKRLYLNDRALCGIERLNHKTGIKDNFSCLSVFTVWLNYSFTFKSFKRENLKYDLLLSRKTFSIMAFIQAVLGSNSPLAICLETADLVSASADSSFVGSLQ